MEALQTCYKRLFPPLFCKRYTRTHACAKIIGQRTHAEAVPRFFSSFTSSESNLPRDPFDQQVSLLHDYIQGRRKASVRKDSHSPMVHFEALEPILHRIWSLRPIPPATLHELIRFMCDCRGFQPLLKLILDMAKDPIQRHALCFSHVALLLEQMCLFEPSRVSPLLSMLEDGLPNVPKFMAVFHLFRIWSYLSDRSTDPNAREQLFLAVKRIREERVCVDQDFLIFYFSFVRDRCIHEQIRLAVSRAILQSFQKHQTENSPSGSLQSPPASSLSSDEASKLRETLRLVSSELPPDLSSLFTFAIGTPQIALNQVLCDEVLRTLLRLKRLKAALDLFVVLRELSDTSFFPHHNRLATLVAQASADPRHLVMLAAHPTTKVLWSRPAYGLLRAAVEKQPDALYEHPELVSELFQDRLTPVSRSKVSLDKQKLSALYDQPEHPLEADCHHDRFVVSPVSSPTKLPDAQSPSSQFPWDIRMRE